MRPIRAAGQAGWQPYFEGLDNRLPNVRAQSELFVERLAGEIALQPHWRVLDFGCGFGFASHALAGRVAEVVSWDFSDARRREAARYLAGRPNAHVLQGGHFNIDDNSVDLIVVNSVVQYMTEDELGGWLARWRDALRGDGRLVLSDLIPPGHAIWADYLAVLRFSLRQGVLWHALRDAMHELQLRRQLGTPTLRQVGRAELDRLAAANGLIVSMLPRSLSHFPHRLAAVLRRR